MRRFEGRRVIVTGAASGIGRATVLRITAEGGSVAALDIDEGGLAETLKLVDAAGLSAFGTAFGVRIDLADEASIIAAMEEATTRLGGLSALCNVAGILHAKHTHEVTLEKWNQVLAVNLTGTFLTCREALPQLVLGGGGAIVNTASSAALGGHPWMAAYAASKGGIISFTKTLAIEYAKQGIRANVVLPGAIITPIHGQFRMPKGADGALIQRIIPVVPYAEPETVADAIAFLASDDARYCNGSELRVDGAMMS